MLEHVSTSLLENARASNYTIDWYTFNDSSNFVYK